MNKGIPEGHALLLQQFLHFGHVIERTQDDVLIIGKQEQNVTRPTTIIIISCRQLKYS
jgi:hypothetical protein